MTASSPGSNLAPIHLPHLLHLPHHTLELAIQDYLTELETLTPLQGWLKLVHQGNYLAVAAQANTITTLTCHRCLSQYNHRLELEVEELIWLRSSDSVPAPETWDFDSQEETLVETLSPQGYFDPQQWLYEQCCLALPVRQLCDGDCPGIEVYSPEESANPKVTDQRWAALDLLRRQLSN